MRSTDRFLTTHTGSLPRPDDLVELMIAKQKGDAVDPDVLEARITEAVDESTRRQVEAGIDVVNDGEMSKPSYATYVLERLNGFGGSSNSFPFADLKDFPKLAQRVAGDPGRKYRRTPGCNAPVTVSDFDAAQQDMDRLKAAAAASGAGQIFTSAASPGVISLFFRNEYYKTHEEYVFAIAEAMSHEYETIAAAGALVQLDCPDLAMGRHVHYADATLDEFRRICEIHIEALNHAVRNIPAEQLRMHFCWGNYPGPHHCDVGLADIIDLAWKAKPHALLVEAANPRHAHEWQVFEDVKLPEGKVIVPGCIEPQSTYIEHPELIAQRIGRYADLVGPENVVAGVDCGFSIHVGMGAVDRDLSYAKLAALAEGARIASSKYFPKAA
ncbi:cobalamin-independent methionine synthase II family protein [Rubellimicrobium rubrum]|uniref:Cobalamin-independent methionine synthase II family protein n=1 Tax=Rubellimicrobium rubrum TaxID=2585369 RepID=A0A5C4MM66_9RHOB|nr:cobalamin-independent methionine synthase II family protein [Rubellimicrobium rubrum]TNC46075.1 cobalamin-independent methionine synthase II family protein [Rubellimicrobium rubrum]